MYYESDYLSHHGVKGQRWGVRRYQNEDGSLTAKGKKKYSSASRYVTKNGETVDILVSKEKSYVNDSSIGTVHTMYVNGKKVSKAYIDKKDLETNINWISTKSTERGKGYAQTMMNHILKYSKDHNGSTIVSLEVPDGDDDARHIYEKNGFKATKNKSLDSSLTEMKRKI